MHVRVCARGSAILQLGVPARAAHATTCRSGRRPSGRVFRTSSAGGLAPTMSGEGGCGCIVDPHRPYPHRSLTPTAHTQHPLEPHPCSQCTNALLQRFRNLPFFAHNPLPSSPPPSVATATRHPPCCALTLALHGLLASASSSPQTSRAAPPPPPPPPMRRGPRMAGGPAGACASRLCCASTAVRRSRSRAPPPSRAATGRAGGAPRCPCWPLPGRPRWQPPARPPWAGTPAPPPARRRRQHRSPGVVARAAVPRHGPSAGPCGCGHRRASSPGCSARS